MTSNADSKSSTEDKIAEECEDWVGQIILPAYEKEQFTSDCNILQYVGNIYHKQQLDRVRFCLKKYPIMNGFEGEGFNQLSSDIMKNALENGFILIRNGNYPLRSVQSTCKRFSCSRCQPYRRGSNGNRPMIRKRKTQRSLTKETKCCFFFLIHYDEFGFYVVNGLGNVKHRFHPKVDGHPKLCYPPRLAFNAGNKLLACKNVPKQYISKQDISKKQPQHNFHSNYDHDREILLAHQYRLSLDAVPVQSSFRVIALIFYESFNTNETSNLHVVGTNDEPCHISGSICAERSAMLQLRFLPVKKITKIVIATDAPHEITPGLLCREYFASHNKVPWNTPVILSGTKCCLCSTHVQLHHINLTYAQQMDINNVANPALDADPIHKHNFLHAITSIQELYPYPSLYVRLKSRDAVTFGYNYKTSHDSPRIKAVSQLNDEQKFLLERAIDAASKNIRSDIHPIQYGAAILYSDGSTSQASQKTAIEYGCTLDAVTQLAPLIEQMINHHRGGNFQPKLLIQADQYGVTHPPFALARAFLTEHGYNNCNVMFHNQDCSGWINLKAHELVPFAPKMEGGLLIKDNV